MAANTIKNLDSSKAPVHEKIYNGISEEFILIP